MQADEIRALVSCGTYIVCDRYCYSGVAYSIASGKRREEKGIESKGMNGG